MKKNIFPTLVLSLILTFTTVQPAAAFPSGFQLPFEGNVRITSGPTSNESPYHKNRSSEAMDFQNLDGKPMKLYATGSGRAYYLPGYNGGFGNVLMIDHRNGSWSFYSHLGEAYVGYGDKLGETVVQGQLVGLSGNSGNGAGNHLHFEMLEGVKFLKNGKPNIYSGQSVKIVDNPAISYTPTPTCCNRGTATGPGLYTAAPKVEGTLVTVYSYYGWQSTKINIVSGQRVRIIYYSGRWRGLPAACNTWTSTKGMDNEIFFPEFGITARFGSLIGKIGESPILPIGSYYDFVSGHSGILYLQMFDTDAIVVQVIVGP
jgi:hypothetical protein